jgi:hypothetical protein
MWKMARNASTTPASMPIRNLIRSFGCAVLVIIVMPVHTLHEKNRWWGDTIGPTILVDLNETMTIVFLPGNLPIILGENYLFVFFLLCRSRVLPIVVPSTHP